MVAVLRPTALSYPPIAIYDFPENAKNEFDRLVAASKDGILVAPELGRRVYALDSLRFTSTARSPCTFIMRNFDQYVAFSDEWRSRPFYTHPQGYKICLVVTPNQVGSDALSVSIFLMWGEYDSSLKWPFQDTITIQLLDQSESAEPVNHAHDVTFIGLEPASHRVTQGEVNKEGLTLPWFIPHHTLQSRQTDDYYHPVYIKDDSLCFQVFSAIRLHETIH